LFNLIGKDNESITVEISEKIPLQGLELDEYNKKRAKEKEEELRKQKEMEEEDSDDEEEQTQEKTHDLLMKEGSLKQRGFFKQASKSFPMYPYIENKVKYDDYGEIINPEDFMFLDPTTVPTDKVTLVKIEEKKVVEEEAVPTKTVTTVLTLNINAKISFIDFEGRSDCDSLKQIISTIKPRRLVLVKGSPEATEALANHCSNMKDFLDKVLTPKVGDVVDATTESHIYQVRLLDSLVSSLSFKTAKSGEQLAWIQGVIDVKQDDEESLVKDSRRQENNSQQLVLRGSKNPSPHTTIFVNEVKLSDFKQILIKAGIQAEFIGGSLCCCGQAVQLKKSQAGRIQIEGTICPSYFKIRELLYQQYAIL
jgi:cleavage and polyadenylation specificity factor subunit 2